METPITRSECLMHTTAVQSTLDKGFEGINDRIDSTNDLLDQLNGKTQLNTVAIAKLETRAEVCKQDVDLTGSDDRGQRRVLTVRDILLVVSVAVATYNIMVHAIGFHR